MKHAKFAQAAVVVTGAVLAAGAAAPAFAAPADALAPVTDKLPLSGVVDGLADGEVRENPLQDPQVQPAVESVEHTGSALVGQLMAARAGGNGHGNAPMVGGLPLNALPLGSLPLSSPLG